MQSRFIYGKVSKKRVTIQGLASTGKTELLLHKLQKLYTKKANSKIAFTCYNKVLANDMRNRISQFFDFMRVEKQIEWDKRLWVCEVGGLLPIVTLDFTATLCSYYNLPFHRYNEFTSFDAVCQGGLRKATANSKFPFLFWLYSSRRKPRFFKRLFDLCEYVVKISEYI